MHITEYMRHMTTGDAKLLRKLAMREKNVYGNQRFVDYKDSWSRDQLLAALRMSFKDEQLRRVSFYLLQRAMRNPASPESQLALVFDDPMDDFNYVGSKHHY